MRKILTLGTILLGGCLAMVGQTGSYSDQSQSGATEQAQPNYSQGQQGQMQTAPENAPQQEQSNSALQRENQKTSVQGCLTQSPSGNFMLADAAGDQYQLNDSSARLDQFVGQEIRVNGFVTGASQAPGAMSSEAPAGSQSQALNGSIQQINVSKVRKVADTCQSSSINKP
jgi:hypothetical protein